MKTCRHLVTVCSALLAVAAAGQTEVPDCAATPIVSLQKRYLECDRVMSSRRVGPELAQHCALIGQLLQRCAFDGDFDRLISWWRRERDASIPLAGRTP